MKIVYTSRISINVLFDHTFSVTLEKEFNKVQDAVESIMWEHHFSIAEIVSNTTGQLLMRLEKDY